MGVVENFISIIKKKEGFRFDKQVAEHIGVDNHSLANAKLRNKLPNNYIMWYCDKYDVPLDKFEQEIKLTSTNVKKENDKMYEFALKLAEEKIIYLEQTVEKLKQKNNTASNQTFESTDYDIITYQTYEIENKTPYKYFSSYEIVRWKDFCKKLGYVGQEAVEFHDYIQAMNSDSLDDYTGKKFNWIDSQKHTAIMDHKYTENFFKNARLKQFINAVEIHTINYIHKDGSHVPATITVMYDMKGHSSVSKIKFLDTDKC